MADKKRRNTREDDFAFDEADGQDDLLRDTLAPPPPRRKAKPPLLLFLLLLLVAAGAAYYYLIGFPSPAPPAAVPAPPKRQPIAMPAPLPPPSTAPAASAEAPQQPGSPGEAAKPPEKTAPATAVIPPQEAPKAAPTTVPAPVAPKVPTATAPAPAAPVPPPAEVEAPQPKATAAAGVYAIEAGIFALPTGLQKAERTIRRLGYEPRVSVVKRQVTMVRLRVGAYAPGEAKEKLRSVAAVAPDSFLLRRSGKMVLYAGSYLDLDLARTFADHLFLKGILVEEEKAQVPMKLSRLTFGSFKDQDSARKAAAKAKAAGLEAVVIKK